jgi:hypothetical protein
LASVVHAASKLRRQDITFLSEGVREYILRYASRADKIAPGSAAAASTGKGRLGPSSARDRNAVSSSHEPGSAGANGRRAKSQRQPSSASAEKRASNAGKLGTTSAIQSDLKMLGQEVQTASAREATRRGGGFNLP